MATLMSIADGNFTTAGTWALCDATAESDSEATGTNITTSYAYSTAFAPGAVTVDGIALKIRSLAGTAGSLYVELYNDTDNVQVKEVIVAISTLPQCSTATGYNEGGWVFFKFDASVLLEAAHDYQVGLKVSAGASTISVFSTATTNWSRQLRTTTTQAPGSGDKLLVCGEVATTTPSYAGASWTVTMNNTATTSFGSVSFPQSVSVSQGGTLNYGYTAATNYYLKVAGLVVIYSGGTFTMGTVANPIPRDGTAVLEFDPTADGDSGLWIKNGSTCTIQGLSRTSGKNIVSCLLNTDEAVGQTELGVDTDTGWLSGDSIAIASTSRTYTECELRTLSENAAAAHLDISSGLTYAHSGTTPTQAEVILLTRNVKIRTDDSGLMAYVRVEFTATCDWDWAEFYYLGEDAAGKRGINMYNTTGSFNAAYCSVHDTEDFGIFIEGSASNNFSITYTNLYNCATVTSSGLSMQATATTYTGTSGSSWTLDNIIVMMCGLGSTSTRGVTLTDYGGTITNITVVGCRNSGLYMYSTKSSVYSSGTLSNWNIHSNGSDGFYTGIIYFYGPSLTISNLKSWINNGAGWYQGGNGGPATLVLSSPVFFGNNAYNIRFYTSTIRLIITDPIIAGHVNYSTAVGFYVGCPIWVYVYNGSFGVASGVYVAHTTGDISVAVPALGLGRIVLFNTTLASSVEVANQSNMLDLPECFISSTKHDGQVGAIKVWKCAGFIERDTETYRTASPSEKLMPNQSSPRKLQSSLKQCAVANGTTATPSVYVYLSGDTAGAVRLMVRRNDQAGITSDTQLASTETVESWEQLTGATAAVSDDCVLEFYVDCSGPMGTVHVDDWSVS